MKFGYKKNDLFPKTSSLSKIFTQKEKILRNFWQTSHKAYLRSFYLGVAEIPML